MEFDKRLATEKPSARGRILVERAWIEHVGRSIEECPIEELVLEHSRLDLQKNRRSKTSEADPFEKVLLETLFSSSQATLNNLWSRGLSILARALPRSETFDGDSSKAFNNILTLTKPEINYLKKLLQIGVLERIHEISEQRDLKQSIELFIRELKSELPPLEAKYLVTQKKLAEKRQAQREQDEITRKEAIQKRAITKKKKTDTTLKPKLGGEKNGSLKLPVNGMANGNGSMHLTDTLQTRQIPFLHTKIPTTKTQTPVVLEATSAPLSHEQKTPISPKEAAEDAQYDLDIPLNILEEIKRQKLSTLKLGQEVAEILRAQGEHRDDGSVVNELFGWISGYSKDIDAKILSVLKQILKDRS